jgi:hypothetical protein
MGLTPEHELDKYLEWQQRLESRKASGLGIDEFCLQEGVSRATFFRWAARLREGIPESLIADATAGEQGETAPATFLPLTLRTSSVEIQLPNGVIVRLPLRIGRDAIVEAIRVAGALPPGRVAS